MDGKNLADVMFAVMGDATQAGLRSLLIDLKHNNISRYMKYIYAVVKELKLAKTLVWSFKNCTGQFSPFKAIWSWLSGPN